MDNKIIYIDCQRTIELHNWLRESTGIVKEIGDINYLEKILQEIKDNDKYPDFKSKLTQLIFAIARSDEFIPDNKLLSLALGSYFLELNGYDYVVHYFAIEMENIVVWLEQERISRDLLAEIIESLIYEEDFNEGLKLKLAIAIKCNSDLR